MPCIRSQHGHNLRPCLRRNANQVAEVGTDIATLTKNREELEQLRHIGRDRAAQRGIAASASGADSEPESESQHTGVRQILSQAPNYGRTSRNQMRRTSGQGEKTLGIQTRTQSKREGSRQSVRLRIQNPKEIRNGEGGTRN